MTHDYRKSHLAEDKGQSYKAMFLENPYRNMVWELEKNVLDEIITSLYRGARIVHLDFACGTGRILHHLSSRVSESVGVDLSPSMLDVARKGNTYSEIIEADLTKDDVLAERKFNLITAFRFFPNAQPELRYQVIRVLASHLSDEGYLVFNNHRNARSARNRLARLLGRRTYEGMDQHEVDAFLGEENLEIVRTYPLCIFPSSENRLLMPIPLLRPIESVLGKIRMFQDLAENKIFVCRRSSRAN